MEEIEIRFQFQRKKDNAGAKFGQAVCSGFLGIDAGGEQGNREFVMTSDRVAAAVIILSWAANDICQWSIGLNEVEVRGGDVCETVAEVTNECHTFQKDFRQDYC